MYEIQIDEVTSTGRIFLGGILKIQEINSLKEALQGALQQVETLKINHEKANSFDLTYLQLLVALHKSASSKHKTILLDEKHPVEFISLVRESGCPSYKWLNIEFEDESAIGGENG